MYTTTPLPTIDTLNSHCGLLVFSLLWIIAGLIAAANYIRYAGGEEYVKGVIFGCLCYFIPVGIVALISFNTGEYKEFANTKVTGTLHSIIAEGYNEEVKSGKGKRRQDVHLLYAVYEIEDRLVPIRVLAGAPLAKQAIFYKNYP